MIGLDTNILVRYIVRDDLAQAKIARSYMQKCCDNDIQLFINNIVICELIWVLEVSYEYEKNQIINVIEQILRTRQFAIEDAQSAWQALAAYKKTNVDLSDTLLGFTNKLAGCTKTATFDKKAAKLLEFELLQ
jgi:predicted nucleic-acid-binding protein